MLFRNTYQVFEKARKAKELFEHKKIITDRLENSNQEKSEEAKKLAEAVEEESQTLPTTTVMSEMDDHEMQIKLVTDRAVRD